jgi:NADH-quinone oxidoreductase subunit E
MSTCSSAPSNAKDQVEITADFTTKVDELVSHYPVSRRSATLPLLHLWQETHGYINDQAVKWIAARLELNAIQVLELVTFYPMFRQHPAGKFQIKVCRTLSCQLGGSYQLREHFMRRLGITQVDEHGLGATPDGKFSVEFVECLASCGTAPVIMINDDFYEGVTPEKADELINKYR